MPDEKPILPYDTDDSPVSPLPQPIEGIEEAPEITPPAKKANFKLIGLILAIILIIASLPVALFLVNQRQEIRKQAEGDCAATCQGLNDSYETYCPDYRSFCFENCRCQCGTAGIGELSNPWCDGADDKQYLCQGGAKIAWPQDSTCPGDQSPEPTTPPGTDCCSGTPECDAGEQCIRTSDPNCSTCQPMPGSVQGWCDGSEDCAHWETCHLETNTCRSLAGCTDHSDCLPGEMCQGGTCTGAGTLECHADINGVRIINNTNDEISGTATWFSRWCDRDDCLCSGSPGQVELTLPPGESWGQSILGDGPPTECSWQSDIQFSWCHNTNHGCEPGCNGVPTPTPTPTIPSEYTISCKKLTAYDEEWQIISDLNTLEVGDTAYFMVEGLCDEPQGITDAKFNINNTTWLNPTGKKWEKFYFTYEIVRAGSHIVKSMVSNPILDWR